MKKLLDNIAALFKVKTIVTIVVIVVFAILAVKGIINSESVMYIVTSVIAFYFGTQHEANIAKNEEKNKLPDITEIIKK